MLCRHQHQPPLERFPSPTQHGALKLEQSDLNRYQLNFNRMQKPRSYKAPFFPFMLSMSRITSLQMVCPSSDSVQGTLGERASGQLKVLASGFERNWSVGGIDGV